MYLCKLSRVDSTYHLCGAAQHTKPMVGMICVDGASSSPLSTTAGSSAAPTTMDNRSHDNGVSSRTTSETWGFIIYIQILVGWLCLRSLFSIFLHASCRKSITCDGDADLGTAPSINASDYLRYRDSPGVYQFSFVILFGEFQA